MPAIRTQVYAPEFLNVARRTYDYLTRCEIQRQAIEEISNRTHADNEKISYLSIEIRTIRHILHDFMTEANIRDYNTFALLLDRP